MSTTLYEATVMFYMQTLGAVERLLVCAADHCRNSGQSTEQLVETSLCPEMYPLRSQVLLSVVNSVRAIEGVRTGRFCPYAQGTQDYAALQHAVAEANAALSRLSANDVNDLEARELLLEADDVQIPFVGKDFLLSFAVPNFYFHASMTYGILRANGVPLGKRDFLGSVRRKR